MRPEPRHISATLITAFALVSCGGAASSRSDAGGVDLFDAGSRSDGGGRPARDGAVADSHVNDARDGGSGADVGRDSAAPPTPDAGTDAPTVSEASTIDAADGGRAPAFDASGGAAVAVSTGSFHTCAIVDGAAWCLGYNTDGELGNASFVDSLVPVRVEGLGSGVTALALADQATCAVVSGRAMCWGYNAGGELGN